MMLIEDHSKSIQHGMKYFWMDSHHQMKYLGNIPMPIYVCTNDVKAMIGHNAGQGVA